MSDQAPSPVPLPDNPNLEWLRKQAKRMLQDLRARDAGAQLADAQFALAKRHGFPSWRALKAHVESLTLDGQLFEAARTGDVGTLASLLDRHPAKLRATTPPYDWSLLHVAAEKGQLATVDLLLNRGLDVNTRERGDETYALHWAAAAGHVDVVRRLIDAGGDVIGRGDDHDLEVIGWASCWDGCDNEAHRAIVDLLVSRGARHHIFSAIAMNLSDEAGRIVRDDPSALNRRQSRNENHRTPLQFAVVRKQRQMIARLLELGADPLAVDGSGMSTAAYPTEPGIDRPVMERIRTFVAAELDSAARGRRPPRSEPLDLVALVSLSDWDVAEHLLRENPRLIEPDGVLHLMAKRNDLAAAKWLLAHGADPNGRWAHWDADVTPLHLAILGDHPEMVGVLLAAGADPRIRDSQHDSDAFGWAEFFGRTAILDVLKTSGS